MVNSKMYLQLRSILVEYMNTWHYIANIGLNTIHKLMLTILAHISKKTFKEKSLQTVLYMKPFSPNCSWMSFVHDHHSAAQKAYITTRFIHPSCDYQVTGHVEMLSILNPWLCFNKICSTNRSWLQCAYILQGNILLAEQQEFVMIFHLLRQVRILSQNSLKQTWYSCSRRSRCFGTKFGSVTWNIYAWQAWTHFLRQNLFFKRLVLQQDADWLMNYDLIGCCSFPITHEMGRLDPK